MKKNTKSPKYTKIADHKIIHFWKPDESCDCEDRESVEISPSFYQDNGTPICSCGCDMQYSHTEVVLPRKKDKTKEPLRRLVNFLEADPDLYKGDDDGTLRRLIDNAKKALK